MLNSLTSTLDFQGKALTLRAERQRVLATNIANADTPGFVARDIDFNRALNAATQSQGGSSGSPVTTHQNHMALSAGTSETQALSYATPSQPSMDGNTVDLDRERASFSDNAIRYESTLRFINGHVKTMLSAIQGQ